jgi:DNA-binding IclR family transcriptional regulator
VRKLERCFIAKGDNFQPSKIERRPTIKYVRSGNVPDIICAAAPVFVIGGKIVCAISVAFPSYVNSDRGIDSEIKAVKLHAAPISGYINGNQ